MVILRVHTIFGLKSMYYIQKYLPSNTKRNIKCYLISVCSTITENSPTQNNVFLKDTWQINFVFTKSLGHILFLSDQDYILSMVQIFIYSFYLAGWFMERITTLQFLAFVGSHISTGYGTEQVFNKRLLNEVFEKDK